MAATRVVALLVTVGALAACGDSSGDAQFAAARPTAGPDVSATLTVTPTPTPARTRGPELRLTLKQLGESTLDLGAWPHGPHGCPEQAVKFHNGRSAGGPTTTARLTAVAYADVDADGTVETAGLFRCEGGGDQVVVFDRPAGTAVEFLAQVAGDQDGIEAITDLRAGKPRTLEIKVADYEPDAYPSGVPQYQWREYSNTSATLIPSFTQSGGPKAFPFNKYAADVSIKSVTTTHSGTTFTITATIADLSPVSAPYAYLVLSGKVTEVRFRSRGTGLGGCLASTGDPGEWAQWCRMPVIPAHGQTKITFTVTRLATSARLDLYVIQYLYLKDEGRLPEAGALNMLDNQDHVTLT